MTTERPKGWPETLIVFDNNGGWSGLAIDPDDDPVDHVQMFLNSMDDHDNDPAEMLDQHDDWNTVEWNSDQGKYMGYRHYTADGKWRKTEIVWDVDNLAFF